MTKQQRIADLERRMVRIEQRTDGAEWYLIGTGIVLAVFALLWVLSS